MRLLPLLFAVFLLVCATPAVAAARVPSHTVAGAFQAGTVGANQTGREAHVVLLTGQFESNGTTAGYFTAAGTRDAIIEDIESLEVYDTGGKPPPQSGGPIPRGTRLPQFYKNVTLTMSDNASLVYYTGSTKHDYGCLSPFALVLPIDPPDDLGGLGLGTKTNTSLAIVGASSLSIEMAEHRDALVVFTKRNVNVTVWKDGQAVSNLTGSDWVYRLVGSARLSLEADALLVPFAGDASATLRPGPAEVAQQELDLNRISQAYQNAIPNATGTPPTLDAQVSEQLHQASAIFNGVLLGNPAGYADLGGDERSLGKVTLYRFERFELQPGATRGDIEYEGSGTFLLVGDQLYTTKAAAGGKTLALPVLSLVLWVLAAAALVLGFVLKPLVAPTPANAARPVRLTALIFHLVMIPLAFVLWDIETRAFLGTSILTLVGGGATQGVAFAAVAGIQSLSFTLAWTYFGLPIRFLVNTGFKLMQLKRARGIGKGLSFLSAWGIGSLYYALLLNPFIGLFVDSLGGFK